jgi:hypothetical protein
LTGYSIYFGTAARIGDTPPGGYNGAGSPITISDPNQLTYSFNSLEDGHIWYFSVVAYNSGGESSFSNEGSKLLCSTYSIAPSTSRFDASGGSGSVTVTTQTGCTWTAVSNASWITITSGNSGNGSGTVQYAAAANAGGTRTGTVTIAGQTFTVIQGTTSARAQIGLFRAGSWYIDRDATFGWSGCGPDGCYLYGAAGDTEVTGDWDGGGLVGMGVFRNGNWYLDYNGDGRWSGCGTTATTDRCYTYGMAGDIPVVGDWSGDGVSKIGLFRNGNWYLDYNGDAQWSGCGTTAGTDRCYSYGMAGDMPVVGNWNGEGVVKIGVFRNGMWYLDYKGTNIWIGCGAPAEGGKDACVPFGMSGDRPVVLK